MESNSPKTNSLNTPIAGTEAGGGISAPEARISVNNNPAHTAAIRTTFPSDSAIYHIFEGLLLAGGGAIFIATQGAGFGYSSYSDNFFFFIISLMFVMAGVVRIITAYYADRLAKYSVITKSLLLGVEGAFIFSALANQRLEYVAFVTALACVNVLRLLMIVTGYQRVKSALARMSVFLMVLVAVSGLVLAYRPSTFPIQSQSLSAWISQNQFIFAAIWYLLFLPGLFFVVSPYGRKTKITSLFLSLGAAVAIVVATELAVQSKIYLAFNSYLVGGFALFLAWWCVSKREMVFERSFIFLAGLVWVSAASVVGLLALKNIHERVMSTEANKMLKNLISIEDSIQEEFGKNAAVAKNAINTDNALEVIKNGDTEAAINISRKIFDSSNFLEGVSVMNAEGTVKGIYPRNSSVTGSSFKDSDFFVTTKEELGEYVSDHVKNPLGYSTIIQTEPIFENNSFAGLFADYYDLQKFSVHISEMLDPGESFFAADKNKQVILNTANLDTIGTEDKVKYSEDNESLVTENRISVHRRLSRFGWDLSLTADSDALLKDLSYLSVFLTLVLVVNGFLSMTAVLYVARK